MATFELDDAELAKSKAWWDDHLKLRHKGKNPYAGAIGGNCGYLITYTTLGMIVHVQCSICQHSGKDFKVYAGCVSDFMDW
jgi:hypothetical protein